MTENQDNNIDPKKEGLAMAEFFGDAEQAEFLMDEAPSEELRLAMREIAAMVETTSEANRAQDVIDELQEREILPESTYTPTLVAALKTLGKELEVDISIGGVSTAPSRGEVIDITPAQAGRFLGRGSLAASFLAAIMVPTTALAQQVPTPNLLDDPLMQESLGGGTINTIVHWDNILGLLLLLGVGTAVAYKYVQRRRKKKDAEEAQAKAKAATGYFDDLAAARGMGDDDPNAKMEAMKAAKEGLKATLMGDIDYGIDEVPDVLNQQELNDALAVKDQVDKAIAAAEKEIDKKMTIDTVQINYGTSNMKINALNKKRDEVIDVFIDHIESIDALYKELAEQWAAAPEAGYLKHQLEYEKQKLAIYLNYLHFLKKKWLEVTQSKKGEIIKGIDKKKLNSDSDKLLKEIKDSQEKLNSILNNQSTLDAGTFNEEIAAVSGELDKKMAASTEAGIYGYSNKESTVDKINHKWVQLKHGGNFTHETGVAYEIGDKSFEHALPENATVQIWINPNKEIHMNVNYNGALAAYTELVTGDKGLHIADTNESIEEYLGDKFGDEDVTGLEASSTLDDLSIPTLSDLSSAVTSVASGIKSGEYKIWGTKVLADDDAIENHKIRVHQEYIEGPKAVVQFKLEEAYWKKALHNMDVDPEIPNQNVNFNYENPHGGKMVVDQPMRRFNVLVGGGAEGEPATKKKQASVLVTANTKLRAMAGDVRIIFDPKDEFTKEEMTQVFSEVAVKLGLQKHFVPVTSKAKERLIKRQKAIRKGSAQPTGSDKTVSDEHQASQVTPAEIEKLRQKGLHSLYHQFNPNALEAMLESGALMSTELRRSKGKTESGMSSSTDMVDGGATEVFLRMHTGDSLDKGQWYSSGKPAFIFRPSMFERMDCFCYGSDKFGSKVPATLKQSFSPEQLVTNMGAYYNTGHEVMFKESVNLDTVAYIVCDNKKQMIAKLKKITGKNTFNGIALEDFVISRAELKSKEL
jgi:hypothetical protein